MSAILWSRGPILIVARSRTCFYVVAHAALLSMSHVKVNDLCGYAENLSS